jgi:hypothetical protein
LFTEQYTNNDPSNSLKGRITEFATRIAWQQSEYPAQTLINRKRIGCEPKPPNFATSTDLLSLIFSQSPLLCGTE